MPWREQKDHDGGAGEQIGECEKGGSGGSLRRQGAGQQQDWQHAGGNHRQYPPTGPPEVSGITAKDPVAQVEDQAECTHSGQQHAEVLERHAAGPWVDDARLVKGYYICRLPP
jgi:hypothetical protein